MLVYFQLDQGRRVLSYTTPKKSNIHKIVSTRMKNLSLTLSPPSGDSQNNDRNRSTRSFLHFRFYSYIDLVTKIRTYYAFPRRAYFNKSLVVFVGYSRMARNQRKHAISPVFFFFFWKIFNTLFSFSFFTLFSVTLNHSYAHKHGLIQKWNDECT